MSATPYRQQDTDIAIVGMAGRFPGAADVDAFWANLRDGVESIRFFTEQELREAGVPERNLAQPNFVRASAVLDGSDEFDAGFFGINPMDAAVMDPQHRIFLELAWSALEDAGYDPEKFSGAIGVFAGSGMNAYMMYNLLTNPELVRARGEFAIRTAGNDMDFLATRASYLLNLRGPSINVQTACSTSLVAVHMAVQSLLTGESDLALAGGITVLLPQQRGHFYREGDIVSPDGHCRAFDAKAAGTVFGSGGGIVVLKRLDQALEDGDTIYAVIKGSAINNDGRSKIGYTAPSVHGQAQVVTEALSVAGLRADDISYIEAHGTGTPVGDPIEVSALTRAFGAQTSRTGFCRIGSVKTNIGHLDTAAGIAGLIKVVQAIRHGQLPPSLHFESPNPQIDFASSPFLVNESLRDWTSDGAPLRAGVTSLGIGGTNAHVIVEQAPALNPSGPTRPWQILVQSARSKNALDAASTRLAEHLRRNPDVGLADVAYTLATGRRAFDHRRVLVCSDRDDAIAALEGTGSRRPLTQVKPKDDRSVVFMFPGQGAQHVDMGRDLYRDEPVFRQHIDAGADLLQPILGVDIRELMYPAPGNEAEAARRLAQTEVTQPVLFVVEYALAKVLERWGVEPDAMIGHSVGEYVAACIGGTFSYADAIHVLASRARLMQSQPAGGMLAVRMPTAELEAMISTPLALAGANAPELSVVSGPHDALNAFQQTLESKGIQTTPLHTSHAFHSSMMDPILEPFAAVVASVERRPPTRPWISSLTGTWITAEQATDPMYWARQLRHTVRFSEGIQTLLREPGRILLEVGPGQTLSTFGRQHASAAGTLTVISTMRHPRETQPDYPLLLTALGQLWMAGLEVDWNAFYGDEQRRRVRLPTYPFEHQRYWIDPGASSAVAGAMDAGRRNDVDDWFYVPTWRETPLVPSAAGDDAEGTTLVFLDHTRFGTELVRRLAGRVVRVTPGASFAATSADSYVIAPGAAADYSRLLRELESSGRLPRRILHMWNTTPEGAGADVDLDRSFYSLLHLAQALGEHDIQDDVHLTVLSSGMQQVAGEAVTHPGRATLLGPCKVIPREFARLRISSVDIELPAAGSARESQLLDQLAAEIHADRKDAVVAWRGHRRMTQVFEHVRADALASREGLLKRDGVYLITGGLGGLGLTLAGYLADEWHARLVLVSRNGLPPREEWDTWLTSHGADDRTAQRIRDVRALEARGAAVAVIAADVTDRTQMRAAVDQAVEKFGRIDGVLHTAGLLEDGAMQLKSKEIAARVLAPKVQGTLVLNDVLDDAFAGAANGPAFMMLFSSITPIVGTAGQVDYAAANAFLDAFAHWRSSAGGLHVVSVNWGRWREVGLAAAIGRSAASRRAPEHPLAGVCIEDTPSGCTYARRYSADEWLLDEHRLKRGHPLLAGVTYLEIARGLAAARAGRGDIEFREVFFLAPFIVPAGKKRDLSVTLTPNGDGYDFLVKSRYASGAVCEHVRGRIGFSNVHPAVEPLSVIQARCTTEHHDELEQAEHIHFGRHWQNIRSVRLGEHEALLTISLDPELHGEVEQFGIHPSMMDMATGGAHTLIPSHDWDTHYFLPFSYGSLRVFRPFTSTIYSHIRYRTDLANEEGIAVFDVTIMDPDGNLLVAVTDYVVRRVPVEGPGGEEPAYVNDDDPPIEASRQATDEANDGISPAEGVEAFRRLVAGRQYPQVIVSPFSIEKLMAEAGTQAVSKDGPTEADAAAPAVGVLHPRPDLATPYVAPMPGIEETLAAIWQRALGIENVGANDNFFELGGHSLMVVTIHGEIQKALDVSYPVAKAFQYPTVSTLAKYIAELRGTSGESDAVAQRAQRQKQALARRRVPNRSVAE